MKCIDQTMTSQGGTIMSAEDQVRRWSFEAIRWIVYHVPDPKYRRPLGAARPKPKGDAHTLDDLARFFLQDIAGYRFVIDMVAMVVASLGFELKRRRFTAEQLEQLYAQLEKSDNQVDHFYAAWGRLALRFTVDDRTMDDTTLQEADRLLAEWRQRRSPGKASRTDKTLVQLRSASPLASVPNRVRSSIHL
jgi:hypothetical protein